MAEVMDLVKSPKQKKVVAFLQGSSKVDPNDPEYKYHSQGILDVLNDLLGDFNAEKRDVDAEWEKTRTSEEDLIADTESQMDENKIAIETLEGDVETLGTEIAQAREDLVDAEALLKDDQQYLKDLTERCEQRAHAYDQRSSMRGQELTALTKALDILENKVLNKDEAANERALLQTPKDAPKDIKKPVSFLQQAQTARAKMTNLLQKSRESSDGEDRKTKALAMIATAGTKLKSTVLMSLAMKAKADPFLKVKELIQKLIERLISEATAEATKKGFCDLELSKAEKNRNHRFADVKRLSAELASLNAKKDALEEELEELATSLKELNAALEEATKLRADSKAENMQTLKDAKAGLAATSEALLILKVFYKQSAKAKVLLQASPIEEDDTGAESGAYKGNQDSAKAILGLLEVIVSDFQRTVTNTQAQEDQEQAEFIKFDRTSKADIGGKETKTELDEQDLAATETSITEKMKDLQTNQDLVDKALEELEELKPMCIDTGMSYEERVEKREEEIEALKGALCQLDAEGVEPSCQ
jgi:chromosome segregation ATPase